MALANKLQPAPGQPLPAQLLVQLQDSNAFIAWLQFVDPELNDDNLAALKSARLCSNAVFNVCQTEELLVTKLSKYIPEGSAMLIAAAYFKLRSASGPLPAQPSGACPPFVVVADLGRKIVQDAFCAACIVASDVCE